MRTLTIPIQWYWKAISYPNKVELLKSVAPSLFVILLASAYVWYSWWNWAPWLGSSEEAWNNALTYQIGLVLMFLFFAPFGAKWLLEQDSERGSADADAEVEDEYMARARRDVEERRLRDTALDQLSNLVSGDRTASASSEPIGVRFVNRLEAFSDKHLGGVKGMHILLTFLLILAVFLIIFDLIKTWVFVGALIAYILYVRNDWNILSGYQRVLRVGLGVGCVVAFFVARAGIQSAANNPASFLASVGNLTGLSFGSQDNTTPEPTATELPIEVVPFAPEHTLQNFNPVFTEGANGELIQTVGFLNDGVNLVIEAEAQRRQRQAEAQENQVLVLNTKLLLEGMPNETGVSESVSVVRDWYSNGVQRSDGTREATSFEERVRAQEEQLRAEGANIPVMLDAATDIRNTYDAFERMLKNLQLNGADEVSNPSAAQAALEDFLVYRARLNAKLEQLGILDRVVEFDQNFVQSFVENAQRKEVTIEQTATPNPIPGGGNPSLATVVATLETPPPSPTPTNTPTPTHTPTPLPTSTPQPPPPTWTPVPPVFTPPPANPIAPVAPLLPTSPAPQVAYCDAATAYLGRLKVASSNVVDGGLVLIPHEIPVVLPWDTPFYFTTMSVECGRNWVYLDGSSDIWVIGNMQGMTPNVRYIKSRSEDGGWGYKNAATGEWFIKY